MFIRVFLFILMGLGSGIPGIVFAAVSGQVFGVIPKPRVLEGPEASGSSCSFILAGYEDEELYYGEDSVTGAFARISLHEDRFSNIPLRRLIPEKLLERWVGTRGYDQGGREEKLRRTAQKLHETRTSFFGFNHSSEESLGISWTKLDEDNVPFSGIRLFDGSSEVLFNGVPFHAATFTNQSLSFEEDLRNRGFELPERVIERETGRPSHLFEMGLLNVERDYVDGFPLLLSVIANQFLDPHYNLGHYSRHSRLDVIAGRNAMVYFICRATHVRLYEKLGFEKVLRPGSQEPVTNSEGLFLMRMTPANLIQNFSDLPLRLRRKSMANQQANENEGVERRRMKTEYHQSLQERAPKILTNWDFLMATYRLSLMHRDFFTGDPERLIHHPWLDPVRDRIPKNSLSFATVRYSFFFEAYYQLAWGAFEKLPAEQRDRAMNVYEIMLADFGRYEETHRFLMDHIEANRKSGVPDFEAEDPRLFRIWNAEEIREFETKAAAELATQSWTSPYLRDWFDGLNQIDERIAKENRQRQR